MVELPFGDNPFASKETPSQNNNTEKIPPTAPPTPRAPPLFNVRQKKRNTHIAINDPGKGDANKKGKTTTSDAPSAVSLTMGHVAKDNFKDEDIVSWSKRGKA